MSSPGGEETGEGGQFYAKGAHILIRLEKFAPFPPNLAIAIATLWVNFRMFQSRTMEYPDKTPVAGKRLVDGTEASHLTLKTKPNHH